MFLVDPAPLARARSDLCKEALPLESQLLQRLRLGRQPTTGFVNDDCQQLPTRNVDRSLCLNRRQSATQLLGLPLVCHDALLFYLLPRLCRSVLRCDLSLSNARDTLEQTQGFNPGRFHAGSLGLCTKPVN